MSSAARDRRGVCAALPGGHGDGTCAALPEAAAGEAGAHVGPAVPGLTFARFPDDQRGDSRVAVRAMVAPGGADALAVVVADLDGRWIPSHSGRHV